MSFKKYIDSLGGWPGVQKKLWKINTFKSGKLMGTDKFGNKYFESNKYFYGAHRFVEYEKDNFDASQLPPEWYRYCFMF
eukprot:Pgem_evm1s4729